MKAHHGNSWMWTSSEFRARYHDLYLYEEDSTNNIGLEEQRSKENKIAHKVVSTAELTFDLSWNLIVWWTRFSSGFTQLNLMKAYKRQMAIGIPPHS